MGSRGRGRGKSAAPMSSEQLGLTKDEPLLVILQPPPKYPPLDYKASEFICNTEVSYMIELKRSFTEAMCDSSNKVELKVSSNDVERYSDWYHRMIHPEVSYEQRFDWSLLPSELLPLKRKKSGTIKIIKKQKVVDVDKKLEELEKKETMQESDSEEVNKGDGDDDEKDPDETAEDEEVEVDEEMDDGTDYVNNYFDNGEGYDEEDDNADDGATF